MKQINVGLVSHLYEDYNLGCVALSISNLKLMDEVFRRLGLDVHYIIMITNSYPEAKIEQYTNNSYEYRYYPRFRKTIVNPLALWNSDCFKDVDLIVNLCGGDGYTDLYGRIRLLAESQVAYVASKKKIPVIYAPQTIGPFNHSLSKWVAKKVLGNIKQIYVRDHQSYVCCIELGLEDHTLEVMDVAFALPYEKQEKVESKKKIGINVSGLLYNGGYNHQNYFHLSFDYALFIQKLIERLSEEDVEIHLIGHVNSKENQVDDDYSVCVTLKEKYPQVILAPRFLSPMKAKEYISTMDLFTGARMHSTIAAFSSQVPVIPIAYSRKFNGLYENLHYSYYIDALSSLTIEQAVDQFMENYKNIELLRSTMLESKLIYENELLRYQNSLETLIKELNYDSK